MFIHSTKTKCFKGKCIHICFSLKKGRSDMTSYPECITLLCRYMKHDNN